MKIVEDRRIWPGNSTDRGLRIPIYPLNERGTEEQLFRLRDTLPIRLQWNGTHVSRFRAQSLNDPILSSCSLSSVGLIDLPSRLASLHNAI